jgi:hypothetical protein
MAASHSTAARRLSLLAGLAGLGLAGCTGRDVTDTLGLTRDAPNEFTVTTRAPLQMPPNFEILPPAPGVSRPQELSERRQAEEALVPETALAGNAAQMSPGQQAILRQAGPQAPPDIRAQVNQETALDQPQQTFTEKLMFWTSPPPPGIVVDPARESQRLRENAALGESPQTGDTPIVQPKRKSLLGEINPF